MVRELAVCVAVARPEVTQDAGPVGPHVPVPHGIGNSAPVARSIVRPLSENATSVCKPRAAAREHSRTSARLDCADSKVDFCRTLHDPRKTRTGAAISRRSRRFSTKNYEIKTKLPKLDYLADVAVTAIAGPQLFTELPGVFVKALTGLLSRFAVVTGIAFGVPDRPPAKPPV